MSRGHLLFHALSSGAPTHFADLAMAYQLLPAELQDGFPSDTPKRGCNPRKKKGMSMKP